MVGSATGQAGGLHANWVKDRKCSLLVLNCHLLASSSTDKVPDVHKAGEATLISYTRVHCILKNTQPKPAGQGRVLYSWDRPCPSPSPWGSCTPVS